MSRKDGNFSFANALEAFRTLMLVSHRLIRLRVYLDNLLQCRVGRITFHFLRVCAILVENVKPIGPQLLQMHNGCYLTATANTFVFSFP